MSWLTTTPEMGTPANQSLADYDEDSSSDYSYEVDPDCDYEWPTPAVTAVLCVVYGLLGLTGFVGNLIVVYTIFFKKGPQSVTSMLLCSLAISDLLVMTVYLPFKVADFVTESWVLGPVPCKLVGYLNMVSPACSACMLMVIGLERFIVILFPLRARSLVTRLKAKLIVAATWIISFILAIPGLLLQTHDSPVNKEAICYKDYQDIEFYRKGFPIYCLVVLYVLPLSVMGFAYTTVCMRLYASTKTSRGLQSMKAGGSSNATKPLRATTNNNANGFSGSANPNLVPSSVDDDPFSAGSETRATAGGGGGGRAGRSRQPRRQRRPVSLKDRQQVILMLILVVVLYAVTWGPMMMIMTLYAFGALDLLCLNNIFQMSAAAHTLTFANSVINPVVYSFMSRNFRQNVREAFRGATRLCTRAGWRGQHGGGRGESAYQSSRYSTTTLATQASSVRRGRSTSDGNNSSPSRGQNIELTQYTRLPNTDTTA